MGEVPGWLLRHTVAVEPYVDWGVYDAARTLSCHVDEKLASAGPTGTQRVEQVTIVAHSWENVPAGSLITLADGRKGYAAATVKHTAPGLPTPDHIEIDMRLAGSYGPAFGETVAILYRQQTRDETGASRTTWARVEIASAAVRLLGSSEAAVGSAETDTDNIEVILPPGTPITSRDRLEVRGLQYDVNGTPTEVSDPQTQARPGVRVLAKRRQA
jgi:head-tail adaptor